MCELIVIDQGNFPMEDNSLQCTNTWELVHLPEPTESHFNKFVDFISYHSFKIRTNSKSWQNFRYISVDARLHNPNIG